MKLQTRILLIFGLITLLGLSYLVDLIVRDIQPNYREALESPVVDLSEVLAALVSEESQNGVINPEKISYALKVAEGRELQAKIFGVEKRQVDLIIYITDSQGKVLYHSKNPELVGADFSRWNDVLLTLKGSYGARTTRDIPNDPRTTVFYVAAPIKQADKIIGVLSVGKPAAENNLRAEVASSKVLGFGLVTGVASLLAAWLISFWIFKPLRVFTKYVQNLRSGKRLPAPSLGKGEIQELFKAFEELREKLEGKHYVEQYLQTLTHELKSPLSGIKASSEVLGSDLTENERQKFLGLLNQEIERIERLINSLLDLAKIERYGALELKDLTEVKDLVNAAIEREARLITEKSISITGVDKLSGKIKADRELLVMALSSLLRNALEFSPDFGQVEFASEVLPNGEIKLYLRDHGPGIPEYALPKLFTRFYSLPRPDAGKKSSGLGLVLAREVMLLHHGTLVICNRPGVGGVEVCLGFVL